MANQIANSPNRPSLRLTRLQQGLILALVIFVTIVATLALAQVGVQLDTRRCAPNIWQVQIPKWLGCAMAEHENLAGGLIAAGGALFAGWLAWSAVREQIDLERASNEPEVVAYLIPDKQHINILNLVVANVGGGAARDVTVEMDADPASFTAHDVHIPARTPWPILGVLPMGEQVHQFFGSALELLRNPALPDFDIHVRFLDLKRNERTNTYRISATNFEGLMRVGTPAEFVTAESVKKIADEISKWGSGFNRLKVETTTAEEERKHQEARHEEALKRSAARKAKQGLPSTDD
jgi:hypothetical protein